MQAYGRTPAEDAGIDLVDEPGPLWQLLVMSLLLSRPISATAALATARRLWAAGWCTPEELRRSSWQARVSELGRGGYRRYDFSTATRLDAMAELLLRRWGGDLRLLRDEAGGDPARIAGLLREFDGIGPTGASVFVREVQMVWPQVRPYVDDLTRRGADLAGLPSTAEELAALVAPDEMARLAAALVRVAKDARVRRDVLAGGRAAEDGSA